MAEYKEERSLQAIPVLLTETSQRRVPRHNLYLLLLPLNSLGGSSDKDGVPASNGSSEPGKTVLFGTGSIVEIVDGDCDLVIDDAVDLGHVLFCRRADLVG